MPTDPAVAGGSLLIVDDPAQLPRGTPATAADMASAQAFADLYTACQNAGDLRRLTALYTDAMFQDFLAAHMSVRVPPANPLEALIAFLFDPTFRYATEVEAQLGQEISASPTPLSPTIAVAEVRDVRVLPDGRLGAVLVQDSRPTEFQIYARVGGRLLLDENMDLRLDDFERSEAMPDLLNGSRAVDSFQSECKVEPIILSELEKTLAALPPEVNVVDDVVSVNELPVGSPASPESVEAVVALEQEFMACLNQQDWPRVLALLTGTGMHTFVEASDRPATELFRATPTPPSEEEEEWGRSGTMKVTDVREVRVLDDGRLGAIVVWDDPESPGVWTETLFHIYERVDGRLLLDEEIVVTRA